MSTLTDRYVWGVLRAVPQAQRTDLESEVRALVADAMEAQVAAGVDPAAAERGALVELGDPERLAARYTDRTLYLIGPRYFPEWRRLLTLLLPIVVPIVAVAVGGATYLGYLEDPVDGSIALAIASGLSAAFNAGVQLVFWFTVVFAVMERTQVKDLDAELAWSPDRLPELPVARATESLTEVALSTVALAVAAIALVWQQVAMPITIDGVSYPLFNPALWSFWLPYFLALLGIEILFHLALYLRGGWTWAFAIVNAALNVAFTVPALWLLQTGQLVDPGLVTTLEAYGLGAAFVPMIAVVTVLVVVVATWDVIDGFRKARLAGQGPAATAA